MYSIFDKSLTKKYKIAALYAAGVYIPLDFNNIAWERLTFYKFSPIYLLVLLEV